MKRRRVASRVVRVGAAVAIAAGIARAGAACTTTPTLDFVVDAEGTASDDAAEDAPAIPADAAVDPTDAAADGGDSADAAEDARRNTCPDAAPPNVAQCCGRVRCVGKGCDDSRCDECHLCAASSVCCIKKVDAAAFCGANVAACK